MKVSENSRMFDEESNDRDSEHKSSASKKGINLAESEFQPNSHPTSRPRNKGVNTPHASSSSREPAREKNQTSTKGSPSDLPDTSCDSNFKAKSQITRLFDMLNPDDEVSATDMRGDEPDVRSPEADSYYLRTERESLVRDTSEARSIMEPEAEPPIPNLTDQAGQPEYPVWQSQTDEPSILFLLIGLNVLDKYPYWVSEKTFKSLTEILYNKDNSMKINEFLNSSIGQQMQATGKGPNSVDIPGSIKLFRELYQLELSAVVDPFVKFENLEIKVQDLFRLLPMVFLNDTTINFYIKLIEKYLIDSQRAAECHFFNTYFMSKLRNEGQYVQLDNEEVVPASQAPREQSQRKLEQVHGKTKRWHRGLNLFDRKYIFIPVNKKDHWFSVIIVNLPSLIACIREGKDPLLLQPEQRPCILLLDPLVNVEENLECLLRLYLECELADKLGSAEYERLLNLKKECLIKKGILSNFLKEEGFLVTECSLPHYQLIIPRQRNTFDCGVFALEYLESFAKDPAYILKRIGDTLDFSDWFPRTLIEQKRIQMIKFLINLRNQLRIETCITQLVESRQEVIENKKNDKLEFDWVNYDELQRGSKSSDTDTPPEHRSPTGRHLGSTATDSTGGQLTGTFFVQNSASEPEGFMNHFDLPYGPKFCDREKRRSSVRAYYSTLPKEIVTICQSLVAEMTSSGQMLGLQPIQSGGSSGFTVSEFASAHRDHTNNQGSNDGYDDNSMMHTSY